jgi:RHS repeat-associated protein
VTKTRAELQADPASVDLSELRDTYAYNARGALVYLPHLDASGPTNLTRDHHDQLRSVAVGTSAGTAHHLSDGAGIRVAKLWDKGGSVELRIWVGGYEVVRKASTVSGLSSPSEELHTLHVMDGDRRVAMVETYTAGAPTGVTGNRVRMQVGNHLGTACVETDEQGGVLTYEEFHPYGTTAWWSEKSGLEVSGKRYRYTGMERDEESGLQYHNARYYVPWLGRWDRADPIGLAGGWNRFGYAGGDPVGAKDPRGTRDEPFDEPPAAAPDEAAAPELAQGPRVTRISIIAAGRGTRTLTREEMAEGYVFNGELQMRRGVIKSSGQARLSLEVVFDVEGIEEALIPGEPALEYERTAVVREYVEEGMPQERVWYKLHTGSSNDVKAARLGESFADTGEKVAGSEYIRDAESGRGRFVVTDAPGFIKYGATVRDTPLRLEAEFTVRLRSTDHRATEGEALEAVDIGMVQFAIRLEVDKVGLRRQVSAKLVEDSVAAWVTGGSPGSLVPADARRLLVQQ